MAWEGTWDGGRTYRNNRTTGQLVYVIERRHRGQRYSIPLDAGNENEARAQLALFHQDPVAFHAKRQTETGGVPDALRIDEGTTQEVLDALKAAGKSELYRKDVGRYLVAWGNALGGRPLFSVRKAELEALLAKWPSRNHRIAALKSFCTYFVEAERLESSKNPAALLKIEKRAAAKLKREKFYSIATVEQHYAALDTQAARDLVVLRAKAGMHGTEIERVASGACRVTEVDGKGTVIRGVLTFIHKTTREHSVALDAQMLAAARRLVAEKYAPGKGTTLKAFQRAARTLTEKAREAAKKRGDDAKKGEKVDPLRPGDLRHSFISWASTSGTKVTVTGGGVDLREVQQIVGHRSGSTVTKDHYLAGIPPLISIPIQLKHKDDPPLAEASGAKAAKVQRRSAETGGRRSAAAGYRG